MKNSFLIPIGLLIIIFGSFFLTFYDVNHNELLTNEDGFFETIGALAFLCASILFIICWYWIGAGVCYIHFLVWLWNDQCWCAGKSFGDSICCIHPASDLWWGRLMDQNIWKIKIRWGSIPSGFFCIFLTKVRVLESC